MITSMDIVEVNPLLDVENHTIEQAVALLGSFLAKHCYKVSFKI